MNKSGAHGESKTSVRRMEADVKQVEAVRLRLGGATYATIADTLGYQHRRSAQRAIESAIGKERRPVVRLYQQLLDQRLDALLRAYWSRAIGLPPTDSRPAIAPDLEAAEFVLKIESQRMRLWGLLAPTKLALTDSDGEKPFIPPELFRGMVERAEETERRLRLIRGEDGQDKAEAEGEG